LRVLVSANVPCFHECLCLQKRRFFTNASVFTTGTQRDRVCPLAVVPGPTTRQSVLVLVLRFFVFLRLAILFGLRDLDRKLFQQVGERVEEFLKGTRLARAFP